MSNSDRKLADEVVGGEKVTMSRRQFAALSGLTVLASFLPIGCAETGSASGAGALASGRAAGPAAVGGPNLVRAAAELVRDTTEQLGNGVTRVTQVVDWSSLPPLGARTTQTVVKTTTPTSDGETVDVEVTFSPPLPIAIGTHETQRIVGRYQYIHGQVQGDMREDVVVITGMVDGEPAPLARKRVLRSLRQSPGDAREQLQHGIALLNRHGHVPAREIPGAMRMIGDAAAAE